MEPEKALGRELRAVSNLIDRRMNNIIIANGAEDVTPVHGMILGYLSRQRNRGREVYQRDIEGEFDIARSTVTSLLKLMEKKGYLRRAGVAHDARLKRLELTDAGSGAFERIYSSITESERLLRDSLAPEEYDELLRLLEKLKASLGKGPGDGL